MCGNSFESFLIQNLVRKCPFRQPANIREGGSVLSHKPVIALITIFQVFSQLLFLKIFYHLKMYERIR